MFCDVESMVPVDWSSQSEKTLLMSTPKCLGDQIWQIYPGKSADVPPLETARVLSELYAFQCCQ